MPRYLDPPTVPEAGGRYAQGVLLAPAAKRLIISGQVGKTSEGVVLEGLEAQTAQAFDNLLAIVDAAGMIPKDIVKLTVFCAVAGGISRIRGIRAAKLGTLTPASTYLEVAGLADRAYLVEIEGEAVREAAF